MGSFTDSYFDDHHEYSESSGGGGGCGCLVLIPFISAATGLFTFLIFLLT